MKSAKEIKKQFSDDLKSLNADNLHIKYLGKKGEINTLLSEVKGLEVSTKVEAAKEINKLKKEIQEEIKNKRWTEDSDAAFTNLDLTIPVEPSPIGHLHPLTVVTRELNQFFHYYGFSVYDGPEIENDWYNFEMMGVPRDHPARELQDTLYVLEPDVLLRTQTSNVEARELEKQEPPIRFVFPGKVFRNETSNKSNAAFFHQYQGVYVDTNVTIGHLKWIFDKSLRFILGQDIEIRYRAKYYPEVEPGLSPDFKCPFCKGVGCEVCKNRGWIEIAGGGMIHPTTLEKAGIDPEKFSGFAFGWGLDRIAMARYAIKDIRLLFDGNIIYR